MYTLSTPSCTKRSGYSLIQGLRSSFQDSVTLLKFMKKLGSSFIRLVIVAAGLTSAAAFAADTFTLENIGNPAIAGAATPSPGGFDFAAAGSDIGGTASDQFSFEYAQRTGDFDVNVRLAGLSLSDAWAKAGLMAREDLSATSRFTATLATPDVSGCFFQYRLTNAAAVNVGGSPVTYPSTWLRLQRVGSIFRGYASVDGSAWSQLGAISLALSNTLYVGVAATSHNSSQATVAQVRDFQDVVG